MKRLIKFIPIILIGLILIPNMVYTLDSGEEALVLRFGEYATTVKKAGINFKFPFADKIYPAKMSEVRRLEFGFRTTDGGSSRYPAQYEDAPQESLMLTGDENLVHVDLSIQYQIVNLKDFMFNVDNPVETLRLISESIIRRSVANNTLDDVLTDNKFAIQQEIKSDIQNVVDEYGLGMVINGVNLQDVYPPIETDDAFKDIARAKLDKESKINEALGYENDVLPTARGDAQKMIKSAEGYKEDRIERAKGDVANFEAILEKYNLGKSVTRTRMYLETLEEILPDMDLYIVDDKSGETVKFLPLTDNVVLPKGGSN
ncbi:FtsH protease activity modulator HflK [Alkaliphilus sp. B6464]|uniref:FtsH protease activity modulator HflK n=1 Tax=Alkaliphilus sp. B6464 TaxID=2731219 RepID=UPI001BAC0688|nr:FtsH protease activity modulator HflK [Alkaliphilus sp. B6464]QUH22153.1 FtsH protease activity modulator HflK [Alkaliphilus sp. B6464]